MEHGDSDGHCGFVLEYPVSGQGGPVVMSFALDEGGQLDLELNRDRLGFQIYALKNAFERCYGDMSLEDITKWQFEVLAIEQFENENGP